MTLNRVHAPVNAPILHLQMHLEKEDIMHSKKVMSLCFLFIAGLLGCSTMKALSILQSGVPISRESDRQGVRFEKIGSIVLVKGFISNQKDTLRFILDTGAFSCLSKERAGKANLQSVVTVPGTDHGKEKRSTPLTIIDTLRIGNVSVQDIGAAIIDLTPLERYLGVSIDGIIGNNFLRQYTVELNYANRMVTFLPHRKEKYADKDAVSVRLKENIRYGFAPEITCKLNTVTSRAILDNGLHGFLVIPRDIVPELHAEKVYGGTGVCSRGLFSSNRDCMLMCIDSVRIGEICLTSVPAMVTDCRDVLIGAKVMELFNLIIDYKQKELSLSRNSAVSFPVTWCHTGIIIDAPEGRGKTVLGTWEFQSSTGIEVGDTIRMVNGISCEKMSPMAIDSVFSQCGIPVELTFGSRTAKHYERKLIPKKVAAVYITN